MAIFAQGLAFLGSPMVFKVYELTECCQDYSPDRKKSFTALIGFITLLLSLSISVLYYSD
jgi:hypothetical protein